MNHLINDFQSKLQYTDMHSKDRTTPNFLNMVSNRVVHISVGRGDLAMIHSSSNITSGIQNFRNKDRI